MLQLRASMLPGYSDCARRSAARQFKKSVSNKGYSLRETVASAGAQLGTSLHSAAAALLRHRELFTVIQESDVKNTFEKSWEEFKANIRNGVEWDATTRTKYDAANQLIQMIDSIVPFCQSANPSHIESALEAEVTPGVTLTGHIDLLEHTAVLSDHKTGARMPSPWAQLGAYAMLCQANGIVVERVAMLYVPRVRADYQPDPIHLDLDADEAKRAAWSSLNEITRHYAEFERTGDIWAFPANPMSMMCTPKYCPAYNTDACRVGKSIKGACS